MVAQPQIVRMLIEHGAHVRGPAPAVDIHPIATAMLNLKTTIQFHGDPRAFPLSPERAPADFEATLRVLLDAGADAHEVLDPTHPESALGVLLTTPRFDGGLRFARLLLDHDAQLGPAAPGGAPLAIAIAQGRDDFVALALEGRARRSMRRSRAPSPGRMKPWWRSCSMWARVPTRTTSQAGRCCAGVYSPPAQRVQSPCSCCSTGRGWTLTAWVARR